MNLFALRLPAIDSNAFIAKALSNCSGLRTAVDVDIVEAGVLEEIGKRGSLRLANNKVCPLGLIVLLSHSPTGCRPQGLWFHLIGCCLLFFVLSLVVFRPP